MCKDQPEHDSYNDERVWRVVFDEVLALLDRVVVGITAANP